MSSRSATVLVIFIVACIAFCLATVFASMTGPISILPNESDTGGVLDNLSALTDSDNNNYQSYGYDDSKDYSQSSSDSQSSEPQIETTTDDSPSEDSSSQNDDSQEIEHIVDKSSEDSSKDKQGDNK